MELHWFYKAWRIRAARVRKTGFLQIPQQLFFYISDENMEFRIKNEISRNLTILHISRPLRKPMLLLCQLGVFRSVPATHTPFHQKSGNFHIFSISGPKSALFGPEWDFGGPCVKPFINTTFWEVFWRPRAGKVHFSPKNWKFRPKTGNSQKMLFLCEKVILLQQCAKPHEVLPFSL